MSNTTTYYKIEKFHNGEEVSFYANYASFTLAEAQEELRLIYNNCCGDDMYAEDWAEAESKERETGAWLHTTDGEVTGFSYDTMEYRITPYQWQCTWRVEE